MAQTSNYWDKRAIKRLTSAEKQSDAYIKRIRKIYDRSYKNIDKEIEKIYEAYGRDTGIDVSTLKQLLTKKETSKIWKELKAKGYDQYVKNNYKSRITRLEQLKAQIYEQAKGVYTDEELLNHECYSNVVKNGYYKTIYDTQMGTGYDFSFSTLDDRLVDRILNERWSGKNYSQRIWGNTDILAESVSEIVGGGLLSGQSLYKTSKQIRDRYNVAQYYAERLVRTETNHFNNEADAMAYEEMGIDEYVFVATLDSRTSEICQDHDNKRYKYKDREVGVNYPPLHPNCRSTTRGYLGEEAERNLKRRARNPITGKNEIIDNMGYKEWLKKQNVIHGKENVDNTFKMVKNTAVDKEQYKRYVSRLGAKNIGTLENFKKIKYNNVGIWNETKYTYRLKHHYDKSIANGELSPLVDFDLYKHYDKALNIELNGIKTVKDVEVKGHRFHFIDRVFGSVEQKRSGVDIPEIKSTLLNNSAKYKEKENSIKIFGENSIVTINQRTGQLVQVNPY